ncbi:winged helix DNA-binding domain-containing protein, partial [Candidatus Roizmanbacteria bacterium]|nr:winged helix DNA-binding domain-containing protein [Candidatus Roizmanbacteria bacterium]
MDITSLRLQNQHLTNPNFKSPQDVVSHFGAMQSQDFAAAKWSVGLRMKQATDEIVETAFNAGKILRTHVMRPTWHFVIPEDIFWMQKL